MFGFGLRRIRGNANRESFRAQAMSKALASGKSWTNRNNALAAMRTAPISHPTAKSFVGRIFARGNWRNKLYRENVKAQAHNLKQFGYRV